MATKQGKKPGRCVFCGNAGLTKEHVWSDWLNGVIQPSPDHSILNYRLKFGVDNEPLSMQIRPYKRTQGGLNTRRLRNVCYRCNNGWMAERVARAKPYAKPLIQGESVMLDEAAQSAMASWIALSTIMAEFLDPKTMGIPADDRTEMFRTHTPPSSWSISLGRYAGSRYKPMRYRHAAKSFTRLGLLPRPKAIIRPKPDTFQVTTYVIGSLLVHAFSSTDRSVASDFRNWWIPKPLVAIWPPRQLTLSVGDGLVLTDNQVDILCREFFVQFRSGHDALRQS